MGQCRCRGRVWPRAYGRWVTTASCAGVDAAVAGLEDPAPHATGPSHAGDGPVGWSGWLLVQHGARAAGEGVGARAAVDGEREQACGQSGRVHGVVATERVEGERVGRTVGAEDVDECVQAGDGDAAMLGV